MIQGQTDHWSIMKRRVQPYIIYLPQSSNGQYAYYVVSYLLFIFLFINNWKLNIF